LEPISRLPTTSRSRYLQHFFGNIVGALFVAVPAFYFYLGDDNTPRLEDAETGQIEPHLHASSSSNSSAEVKQ